MIPDNAIISPEPQQGKKANGVIEFRSDQWAEIYSRRVDATVAALKSKGVPVFWVGLPAIRGPRATADAVYLNDLYRARAERAGAVYVDVWDGFVDEAGKFTTQGPDFEGQVRRLRSGDGVYFTKAGARKLAHYVEREIRRYMNNRAVPVALPLGPAGPVPEAKSAVRPLAGPVLPLTVTPGNSDELAGGNDTRPVHSDAIAASVLVKGDPVAAPAGRADDFSWPRSRRGAGHRRVGGGNGCARTRGQAGGEVANQDRGQRTRPKARARSTPRANPNNVSARGRRRNRRQRPKPQPAAAAPAAPDQADQRIRSALFSAGSCPLSRQRGSSVDPIRNLSTACAAWRPSRIAQTTSDCPRRMSPAANTFGIEV